MRAGQDSPSSSRADAIVPETAGDAAANGAAPVVNAMLAQISPEKIL